MSYLDLTIEQIHEALLLNKVTPLELVKEALKRAREDDCNAFETICEEVALEQINNLEKVDKNSPLWGIPYVIKDNYSTKGILSTGSSDMLSDYVPEFSSEVYERLTKAGAILIGKTTLDELAMGGSGMNGHKGYTFNPWDKTHTHMVGGSSCGSASACASGIVPFAIGSDTGDSVRKPASYAGLVGLKPTWGRISRFGLFPFAPSLDHVAFFTRNVKDSALLLEVLAGEDERDLTCSKEPVLDYSNIQSNSNYRIAIIKEIFDGIINKQLKKTFENTVDSLKQDGYCVDVISMDMNLLKAIYPTYFVLSSSESTSNNAYLDGIKFGHRENGKTYEEIVMNSRTKGFGELVKRRFIIGGYSLLKENQKDVFLRAQKARRLIVDAFDNVLKQYDAIFLPASPDVAPLFGQGSNNNASYENLIADNYLAFGNFGGFPSITVPLGFSNGLPYGGNITCGLFKERELFAVSKKIEEITKLSNLIAGK